MFHLLEQLVWKLAWPKHMHVLLRLQFGKLSSHIQEVIHGGLLDQDLKENFQVDWNMVKSKLQKFHKRVEQLRNLSYSYDLSAMQKCIKQTGLPVQCNQKLGLWSLGLQVKGKSCWNWNDVTNIGVIWKFEPSILCCVSSHSLPMVHRIFSLLICMGSLESSTQLQSF